MSSPNTPKFHSPSCDQSEMLGHVFTMSGDDSCKQGREGNTNEGSLCGQGRRESVEPLLLLIQATQVNGRPLPIGSFTAQTIATVVHNQMGHLPIDGDVMSNHDAVIELDSDVRVGEVTQSLHGVHEWDGQQAEINCLLSTHHSVMNVVHE